MQHTFSKRASVKAKGNIVVGLLIIVITVIVGALLVPRTTTTSILNNKDLEASVMNSSEDSSTDSPVTVSDEPKVVHVTVPQAVKAVYISSWVGGTESLRSKIIDLIDKTEINAVVLDIKDYTGMISFMPDSAELQAVGCIDERIKDIKPFIQRLHDKNIYVIGRVAVFQDPCMVKKEPSQAVKRQSDGGVWKDKNGISWIDAGSQKIWDYNIQIARTAHEMGFDEINFDYIRYPSDGNMLDIAFPVSGSRGKADTMEAFFKYIDKELRGGRAGTSSDPVFVELVAQYGLDIAPSTASRPDIRLDGKRVETPISQAPRMIVSADLF